MRPPKFLIKLMAYNHARKLEKRIKNPIKTQRTTLKRILASFKSTQIAHKYDLEKIKNIEDLKTHIKVTADTDITDITDEILKTNKYGIMQIGPLKYMAKTSGSTNKPKYIPYTSLLIKNFQRFSFEVFLHFSYLNKRFDIMEGNVLVGPSNLQTEDNEVGLHIGTGTGIMTSLAPKFSKKIVKPSLENLQHKSYEDKLQSIVDEAYPLDIRSFTCAPAFAVPILEKLFEKAKENGQNPTSLKDIWPNLAMYSYSGSTIAPYKDKINSFLKEQVPYLEIYSSTESPLAYQYSVEKPNELLLDLESSFYLFQEAGSKLNSKLFDISEVEVGKKYSLILTTYGGLFNYRIGDIIEFTSLTPPLIKIIGREKEESNIAGTERLSLEIIKQHMKNIEQRFSLKIARFFLCSYTNDHEKLGYHWCFELENFDETKTSSLLKELDEGLYSLNSGYKGSRDSEIRLTKPKLSIVPVGSVDKYVFETKQFGQGKFLTIHNKNNDTDKFFSYLEAQGIEIKNFIN